MIRHFVNIILWLLPPSRMFCFRRFLLRMSGVGVGARIRICGRGWIYGRGSLQIGEDTWFSPGVIFYTHLDADIKVGARCDFGPGVSLITGSHVIGNTSRRAGAGTAKAINVGDGCWIGAGATILGGVSIGRGCIVAAGSLVNRDVVPNTLVAGVPAVTKKLLP